MGNPDERFERGKVVKQQAGEKARKSRQHSHHRTQQSHRGDPHQQFDVSGRPRGLGDGDGELGLADAPQTQQHPGSRRNV